MSVVFRSGWLVFNSITIEGLLSPPSGQEKEISISLETKQGKREKATEHTE